jgi:hypothetical protein
MKSVNELLTLFMRQAHLERAIKRPERELDTVRQRLAAFPEAMKRKVAAQDL